MPEVSVIIPMYNAGRYIIRCLESLRRQTMQDFELLLIDDGSTDKSARIAQDYLLNHPDFADKTQFIKKPNSGVADTRNLGIEEAHGTYITFMDQDDFIAKDYLETYLAATNSSGHSEKCRTSEAFAHTDNPENKPDIVIGGFLRVGADGKILKKKFVTKKPYSKFTLIVPWAHLYRRAFLIDNKIEFLTTRIGEDIYFTLPAYMYTDNIRVIHYAGYRWFYNNESVSNSVHKTLDSKLDIRYLLDSVYEKMEEAGANSDPLIRYFYLRFICWYFLYSTKGSKKENIREAYRDCFTWLKENMPDYRKQKYIGLRWPRGESFSLHACVFGFYLLEKLHLLRPALLLLGTK